MRSKLLFLIVLIVTFAALPGSVIANLVFNPGFDDQNADNSPWVEDLNPDQWTGWSPGGSRSWIETGGVSGAGVELTATAGTGQYLWPDADGAPMDIPIITTEDYYFAVKAKGGTSLDFKIEWHATDGETGAGGLPSVAQTFTTGLDWQQLQLGPLTPDSGAGFVRFVVINNDTGTTVTIDDAWVDTYLPAGASGVHSPDPADDEAVLAGQDLLRWTRFKGQKGDDLLSTFQICEDCNDTNFDISFETLFTDQDINSCSLSGDGPPSFGAVTAEHIYAWRVNCEDPNGGNYGVDTLVGPIWQFTTVNTAPVVDAGPKQAKWEDSVPNPVTFQLAPTVSDDGLPSGTLTYQWTDSGPGTVTYSPPGGATEAPTATMSVDGDYILTLTVDDGSGGVADTVKLRVYDYSYTGIAAWYDMEEGGTAGIALVHDDYSDPVGANRAPKHGERLDDIDDVQGGSSVNTTFVYSDPNGHNDTSPGNYTGAAIYDGIPGGMLLNDGAAETGYIRLKTSQGDPNENAPGGAVRTWADFEDEVSVAAWVKIAAGDFNKPWQSIVCNGNTSWRLQQNDNSGSLQFSVNGASTGAVYGGISIDDGKWHHVMGTYDGAEIALYVDGVLDDSAASEGSIDIGNDWLAIGQNLGWLETDIDGDGIRDGDDTVTDSTFIGIIDEVQIYEIGIPYTSDHDGSISVTKIYQDLDGHRNCATYLAGDIDEDCYVGLSDVNVMAGLWVECNDIGSEDCIP